MLIEAGLHDFEDFSNLEPGVYTFAIKEPMEVTPTVDEKTDIGGKLYTFIVKPEVVGGERAGKKMRKQMTNRSKASRYFLRSFLEKIGVTVTKEGNFSSEAVLGKKFKSAVVARSYKDKTTGDVKTASDFDENSIVAL